MSSSDFIEVDDPGIVASLTDKDQNNTYAFTTFRINLYQVIYAIKLIA